MNNYLIAFEEGQNHAAECHNNEMSKCSPECACPYESEEMKKGFMAGYRHYYNCVLHEDVPDNDDPEKEEGSWYPDDCWAEDDLYESLALAPFPTNPLKETPCR